MSTGQVVGITLVSVTAVLLCGVVVLISVLTSGPSPDTAAATGAPAPAATTAAAAPSRTPGASPSSSAPATAAMPKLVGLNAAVAMDQLKRLGLTNVQLGSQDADDKVVLLASNWTVTKQSTAPGTAVPVDTLIVLTCTKKA